ncbi:MucB/RseB C-terminal domain-containing protein [Thalassotalea aquiviva]|uniref:MucB/RseB C-terminal domain-containing protein n=1 Tax=Thalassotalea aquiviva TaxID=3242415 RepID=UPI00352A6016
MKSSVFLLALATTMLPMAPSSAQSSEQQPNSASSESIQTAQVPTALQWMQRLTASLKQLNFDTSFVVVKNNRAEPYRWLHGVAEGKEMEIITLLNGPRKEFIRRDNVVSYFEMDNVPYSVVADSITGPIPNIFWDDISKLQQSYDFIGVGKSRILGRSAQLIRLESKDKQRFGYWLWLDTTTGLLLKSAIISQTGELLEQIQFTHLAITDKSNEILNQLINAELPTPISHTGQQVDFSWQVNWLPDGFVQRHANRNVLSKVNEPVESLLFNDGLVDVSVYVSPSDEAPRKPSINQTGATVLLSQLRDGYEINVVGKIPPNTALAIADSVSFN